MPIHSSFVAATFAKYLASLCESVGLLQTRPMSGNNEAEDGETADAIKRLPTDVGGVPLRFGEVPVRGGEVARALEKEDMATALEGTNVADAGAVCGVVLDFTGMASLCFLLTMGGDEFAEGVVVPGVGGRARNDAEIGVADVVLYCGFCGEEGTEKVTPVFFGDGLEAWPEVEGVVVKERTSVGRLPLAGAAVVVGLSFAFPEGA